jgi:hypothetical protein
VTFPTASKLRRSLSVNRAPAAKARTETPILAAMIAVADAAARNSRRETIRHSFQKIENSTALKQ